MRCRGSAGRQSGLTLVEILVTIVVAAIFFALAVPLFVLAQKQSSGDRARVLAANVGQAELEAARSMKYGDLPHGDTTYVRTAGERQFTVHRTITNMPLGASDANATYKYVTVDVTWSAPPRPVHIVFKTAIYPQYRGPEITSLTVRDKNGVRIGPKEEGPQLGLIYASDFPLSISADVNPIDWDRTAYVRFTIAAKTGSFATYKDVTKAEATNPTFTWSGWDDANVGDGDYTFSAVAVSTTGKMGDSRTLNFTILGRPSTLKLLAEDVRPGNGLVVISWSAPMPVMGDLDHYELLVVDPDGSDRTVADLDKRSTTYIDRPAGGLSPGTYRYSVVAVDGQGNKITSDQQPAEVVTNTQGVQGPASPTDFSASLLDAFDLGIITQNATLTWALAAGGVQEYWLCREDVGVDSPIAVLDGSEATYMDPQIGWGETRTYYLTAVDADLNESGVASTQATTPPPPQETTFSLRVTVSNHDAIVTVASLVTGDVYNTQGDRIVPDPNLSYNAFFVGSNQKNGILFSNLPHSTYHVTIAAVDSKKVPIAGLTKEFDVELVRNENLSITL